MSDPGRGEGVVSSKGPEGWVGAGRTASEARMVAGGGGAGPVSQRASEVVRCDLDHPEALLSGRWVSRGQGALECFLPGPVRRHRRNRLSAHAQGWGGSPGSHAGSAGRAGRVDQTPSGKQKRGAAASDVSAPCSRLKGHIVAQCFGVQLLERRTASAYC